MIILRFKIRSKPERSDEVMAALAEIVPTARATEGVINFDIARVLRDPDAYIATAVYEDGAALERQERPGGPLGHGAVREVAGGAARADDLHASPDPTLV